MIPLAEAALSFARTRHLSRPGLSRAAFEAAQARALNRWLASDLPRVAAYPSAPARLQDLPVTDKAGQPVEDKPKATSPRRNARAATPKKAAEAVATKEA